MMAREYSKRPSEIVFIDDEYTAYCFDDAAFYLLAEATRNDGSLDWSKFKWHTDKLKSNKDLMRFIEQHS